jgi:carboxymethylenebutenolidase
VSTPSTIDPDALFTSVTGAFVDLGDGRRGYAAHPAAAAAARVPGVLLIQEAFGVNAYVQSEVRRLAEAGYAAIAPDLYRGVTLDYADRSEAAEKMKTAPDAFMLGEIRAAAAYLDAHPAVTPGARGVVGFCMGGRLAFLTAAEFGPQVRAAAVFYGGGIAPEVATRRPAIGHRVPDVAARLLFNYGADDTSILPDEHGRLAEACSKAKLRYTIDVYDGAPHAFANCVRESYRPAAAASAWAATLRLFDETLR